MKEEASLFRYELAIVLIIKDGAVYMPEWIEYHLLAGVDHFYIYDNDSSDNLFEVLKPYIDGGVVDYKKFPGKRAQCAVYNDAVDNHRFDCRYMAFIDDDEFLRPVDERQSIKDVLHEIFEKYPEAAGLTVNGFHFGSSGFETADFSRGVTERFVRRMKEADIHPKIIANPRLVERVENPHYMNFFHGLRSIDSGGNLNSIINYGSHSVHFNDPPLTDKIFYNHYALKSREEYAKKFKRGDVFFAQSSYNMEKFNNIDLTANEVFDDGIIRYIQARQKRLEDIGGGNSFPIESRKSANGRLFNALIQNILPSTVADTPKSFFKNKLCIFLQCRAVSHALAGMAIDRSTAEHFEELALRCIVRSMTLGKFSAYEFLILLAELPKILRLHHETVDKVKDVCREVLPQLMMQFRLMNDWNSYRRFDCLAQMLDT